MKFFTRLIAEHYKRHFRLSVAWALAGSLLLPALSTQATEGLKIPNLGESSTSLFSADYEYNMGQWWLKSFRRQAPTLNDPLLYSYIESLVFDLVTYSDLQDRRLEFVVVDNL